MKNKFYILTTLILSISFLSSGQSKIKFDTYGESFDVSSINDYTAEKELLFSNPDKKIKIEGEILSTCPMKGCWMKMSIAQDTILVRFKDYGFFVPKEGIAGDKTIINGMLSVDTLSVALLRHYAEDAGKSLEEIKRITEPEVSMTFLADGVLIRKE